MTFELKLPRPARRRASLTKLKSDFIDDSGRTIVDAMWSAIAPGYSSHADAPSNKFARRAEQVLDSSHSSREKAKKRSKMIDGFTLNKLNLAEIELAGRDKELEILKSAFQKLSNQSSADERQPANAEASACVSRLVSITGATGTGKSVLAKQLQHHAIRAGGYFCTGKFDLKKRAEPYSAFASAFQRLAVQLVRRDEEDDDDGSENIDIATRMQQAVGGDAAILLEVMPGLRNLFPRKLPPPRFNLNVEQLKVHLHFVIRKVIRVVCNTQKPLVVLLDDVQWADLASLELAETLLADPKSSFLLLTTCRSDSVRDQIPFLQKVAVLKKRSTTIQVQEIALEDLNKRCVAVLLANALRSTVDFVRPLADIMFRKTRGNPFVVVDFLKSLVHEDLLRFNFALLKWSWDERKIQVLTVSDCVADLLMARIQCLPGSTQLVLQVAACLGSEFEGNLLRTALDHLLLTRFLECGEPLSLNKSLERCQRDGLLEKNGSRYTFAHDQVKEAAFDLIPSAITVSMQLEIGRRLLRDANDSHFNRRLYMALNLCNCGESLIRGVKRNNFAEFNLRASERALNQAAFSTALRYAEYGLIFLEESSLERSATGDLRVLEELQKSSRMIGSSYQDLETWEEAMERVFQSSSASSYDKVRAYQARIVSLIAQDQLLEALIVGVFILRECGTFQHAKRKSELHSIVKELTHTMGLLRKYNDLKGDLSELSHREGRMAKDMIAQKARTALNAAILYLESSLKGLQHEASSHLRLQLSIVASEATYCLGNFTKMELHMHTVVGLDGSVEEKLRMYRTRMVAFGAQERFDEAIATGLFILKELGMVDNVSSSPSSSSFMRELKQTHSLLEAYDEYDYSQLPVLEDAKRIMAMGIIHKMTSFTFMARPKLCLILCLKVARWSIKYGVCQYSPPALAMYGTILCSTVGNFEAGTRIGDVALAMSERIDATETLSATSLMVFAYIRHWTNDLRSSAKALLYGYQIGMDTGHVDIAVMNLHSHDKLLYHAGGSKLKELVVNMAKNVDLMREFKHDAMANLHALALQSVLNVMGKSSNPLVLAGQAMHQDVMFDIAQESHNTVMAGSIQSWLAHLAYLFDDYEASVEHAERSQGFGTKFNQGAIEVHRHLFFKGLAYLALAHKSKNVRRCLQSASEVINTFRKWLEAGNINVRHCVKLLEAEMAWIKGKAYTDALYEEAVKLAGRAGFQHDQALAHARAGQFHLARNDKYWAAYHLDCALQGYTEWGANGVASHLARQHSAIFPKTDTSSETSIDYAESVGQSPMLDEDNATPSMRELFNRSSSLSQLRLDPVDLEMSDRRDMFSRAASTSRLTPKEMIERLPTDRESKRHLRPDRSTKMDAMTRRRAAKVREASMRRLGLAVEDKLSDKSLSKTNPPAARTMRLNPDAAASGRATMVREESMRRLGLEPAFVEGELSAESRREMYAPAASMKRLSTRRMSVNSASSTSRLSSNSGSSSNELRPQQRRSLLAKAASLSFLGGSSNDETSSKKSGHEGTVPKAKPRRLLSRTASTNVLFRNDTVGSTTTTSPTPPVPEVKKRPGLTRLLSVGSLRKPFVDASSKSTTNLEDAAPARHRGPEPVRGMPSRAASTGVLYEAKVSVKSSKASPERPGLHRLLSAGSFRLSQRQPKRLSSIT